MLPKIVLYKSLRLGAYLDWLIWTYSLILFVRAYDFSVYESNL
jgi:hypothetical protein